jgi:dienelactone hydrolase
VAAIGIGMGGTLTFEAAIKRNDLEATIAYSGFPQHYLGQFHQSNTPILAMYGSEEPFIKLPVIKALRDELAQTPLHDKHEVVVVEGAKHDLFAEHSDQLLKATGKEVINHTLGFLETYLELSHEQRQSRS